MWIIIAIVAIGGIGTLAVTGVLGSLSFAVAGTGSETPINLADKYPVFNDRLVVAKMGALDCSYTGGLTAYSEVTGFFDVGNPSKVYAKFLECPADAGSQGCEFKIDVPSCAPKTGLNCFAASTPQIYSRSGANANSLSAWQSYSTSTIKLSAGQSYRIELACADTMNNNNLGACRPGFASTPGASFRQSEKKIRVTGECGYNGWLPGSAGCQLVSTELDKLKKMQETDDPLSLSAGTIDFGQTQSFVACWDDLPILGNVNPLGKYQNKDVFCSPFDGLYEARLANTVGGNRYFMQGSQLISKGSSNSFCCSNSQCGGTATCENYKCVEKPVQCGSAGTCNQAQNGDTIALDKEVERSGKFFLQTDVCTNGCIDRKETSVKCTKSYCDKMSSPTNPLYCVYDEGCKSISVLKECPAGSCCTAGGMWKPQTCASGSTCCGTSTASDSFIGTCQSSCVAEPTCSQNSDCNEGQICNNGKCQAPVCEDKFGGLVPGKIVYNTVDGIFSDKESASCEYDYSLVWILAGLILLIAVACIGAFAGLAYLKTKKKRR